MLKYTIQETVENSLPNIEIIKLKKKLKLLNKAYIGSLEKVSYYYEDLTSGIILSYNPNTTFYAASTMKLLVCMYLYELSLSKPDILEKKLKYTKEYQRAESNYMKKMTFNSKHSIKDLIKASLDTSDNSAYKMLMDFVGIKIIKEYGNKLGAQTTMIGRDHYGIVNANDYVLYLKKLLSLQKENSKFNEIIEALINSKSKRIKSKNIGNKKFACKYGSWDIAYHACCIIYDEFPFILCIFTQKNLNKDKEYFINFTAKEIYKVHKFLCKNLYSGNKNI